MMKKEKGSIAAANLRVDSKVRDKYTNKYLTDKTFCPKYEIYTHPRYVRAMAMAAADSFYRQNWLSCRE